MHLDSQPQHPPRQSATACTGQRLVEFCSGVVRVIPVTVPSAGVHRGQISPDALRAVVAVPVGTTFEVQAAAAIPRSQALLPVPCWPSCAVLGLLSHPILGLLTFPCECYACTYVCMHACMYVLKGACTATACHCLPPPATACVLVHTMKQHQHDHPPLHFGIIGGVRCDRWVAVK